MKLRSKYKNHFANFVGTSVTLTAFVLKNDVGDQVEILNFGARITQWHTQVGQERRNIILGYNNLEDYLEDTESLGAIVGPYANRIAYAKASISGEERQLDINQAPHHLHGGSQNLGNRFWSVIESSDDKLILKCELEDGLSGYPGNRIFYVEYQLSVTSCLTIKLSATTDKSSIIGPTSHPYFNLAGFTHDHKGHKLQIFAEHYTQLDQCGIPTGDILEVNKSELDFRQARTLSDSLESDVLDHNFVRQGNLGSNKAATLEAHLEDTQAILTSPDNKLVLAVSSDYPGLQVYSGNHLSEPFPPQSGICLEPQFYPDSPNHTTFPYEHTEPETGFEKNIYYQLLKPAY